VSIAIHFRCHRRSLTNSIAAALRLLAVLTFKTGSLVDVSIGVYVIFWGKPNEARSITKVVSFIFFCMFLFLVCWRDAE
jgi:hypothetical protein